MAGTRVANVAHATHQDIACRLVQLIRPFAQPHGMEYPAHIQAPRRACVEAAEDPRIQGAVRHHRVGAVLLQ
jgi:hypothetical protein